MVLSNQWRWWQSSGGPEPTHRYMLCVQDHLGGRHPVGCSLVNEQLVSHAAGTTTQTMVQYARILITLMLCSVEWGRLIWMYKFCRVGQSWNIAMTIQVFSPFTETIGQWFWPLIYSIVHHLKDDICTDTVNKTKTVLLACKMFGFNKKASGRLNDE